MQKKNTDFSTIIEKGAPSALFRHYALPQLFGMLFNSIYVIVDGVFIGNVLGRNAMAAAGVAVPLVEILIALSMAIGSGAGVMISGLLARDKAKDARGICNASLVLTALLGAVIASAGNLLIDPLADLLGATPEIHEEAVIYMRYILSFSPFMLYSYLLNGLLRNDGAPGLAMFAMSFGSVLNIFLDWFFMCPLEMGIGGAALATAVGPVFSCLIMLPHFLGKKGRLYFSRTPFSFRRMGNILEMGFPSFIMEFTIGIVTLMYNTAIGAYGFGEIGLAAYLVIGYLVLIVLTVFLGLSEGLQPVFSWLYGAGRKEKYAAVYRYALRIMIITGVLAYVLILFFSPYFYMIFNPEDSELIRFAAQKSNLYFWGFFAAGYNILTISYWQSTQRTGKALLIALCRSLLWQPVFLLILPRLFGAEALWFCHSVSECATMAVGLCLTWKMHTSRT